MNLVFLRAGDPQQLQQGGAILDQNGGGLQPDLSQLSEEERAHIEQVSRQSSFRAGEQTGAHIEQVSRQSSFRAGEQTELI